MSSDEYFMIGVEHSVKEETKEAIEAFQKALDLEPTYGKAWYNLAVLYAKEGMFKKAEELEER